MGNRYVLLVGIDTYLQNDHEKPGTGQAVSLNNLQGCVNDIGLLKNLLQTAFHVHKLTILTSSEASETPGTPQEASDKLPTFDNIKREFDNVYNSAQSGDLFFFHYSGHGGRLPKLSTSPEDRSADPSLLTVDYCRGKPAIRGWQLNQWLKRLSEKRIQVIVSLDSCYSAGSWRNEGSLRTPPDWTPRPNGPEDEAAGEHRHNNRDCEMDVSWDINPDCFTLMAACESTEYAQEKRVDGVSYGMFTYTLADYLTQNRQQEVLSTYRKIRDHISEKIQPQSPRVYGQDRLAFFQNKEIFSATPIPVDTDGKSASLPIGKVHGVKKGAEFATFPPLPEATFRIIEVEEYESRAESVREVAQVLPRFSEVLPSRWSMEGKPLNILVGQNFAAGFLKALQASLMDRVVGNVEVAESPQEAVSHDPEDADFWVKKGVDGAIDIFGPEPLIVRAEPVQGLQITGASDNDKIPQVAAAIAHLVRFKQILNLKDEASEEPLPFRAILEPDRSASGSNFKERDIVKLSIENLGPDELHFTVINLGPGFHVAQLFPQADSPQTLPINGKPYAFKFRLTLPSELRRQSKDGQRYRDIIRIIVTKGRKLSVKSLELPSIWDNIRFKPSSGGRDGVLIEGPDFDWWIEDKIIWMNTGTA
ncbi:TPR domain-containing protein [Colletotrichum truncatum]|uniref:TPR domain-containing protein n=1 Tax=Colletotrichum truncatum TaxID=5467 RepID=A0ACC3YL56_COLTU|nr:TPR domain-containing protein [Colletotrichum truncatum]KAF6782597.1 TPR domain-containing protein [Colletotrichum truncatum]